MGDFCDLSGQVAIVTGASSGIGRATAKKLAGHGARVVLAARRLDRLEQLAVEIKNSGGETLPVQTDVSKKIEVQKMVEATVAAWNRIDILVNNAGVVKMAPFLEMTEEDWDLVLDVNLKGQFLVGQAVAKVMKEQDYGRIVNTASIASGQQGFGAAMAAHYTASKGGVVALTESMADELAPYGILVNALAPGLIETEMTEFISKDKQALQTQLVHIPLKRIGTAEEMANVILFLVSKENSYMTGSMIVADGGWLAA